MARPSSRGDAGETLSRQALRRTTPARPGPGPRLVPAQRTDARAVPVVPAALEAAIAEDFQHQVDVDASRGHGTDQGAALPAQVLTHAATHIAVEGDADVMPGPDVATVGAVERPLKMENVDDGVHATPSRCAQRS